VSLLKGLAVSGAAGAHLHDPAGANPGLANVIRRLLCPQRPADFASVADLVIGCHNRDVPLPMELAADLAVERLLVGYSFGEDCIYDRQQEVGPLLLEELINGR
jgi:hypothetical protein